MNDGNKRPDSESDPDAVKRRRGDIGFSLLEKAQRRRESGFSHKRIVADESDRGETHRNQEQGKTKHVEHDFESAVQLDLFVLLSLAHNFLLIDLRLQRTCVRAHPNMIYCTIIAYPKTYFNTIFKKICPLNILGNAFLSILFVELYAEFRQNIAARLVKIVILSVSVWKDDGFRFQPYLSLRVFRQTDTSAVLCAYLSFF